MQVAALCCRDGEDELEVLLVTSRGRGRWILPKGWPELQEPGHKTALTEAFEEAGVIGTADSKPYAHFRSIKGLDSGFDLRTKVSVFKVKVTEQLPEFPEAGQRELAWFPVSQAIEAADEAGLKVVLRRLQKETLAK